MKPKYLFLFSLFFATQLFSQKINYSSLSIPDNLKENANSVILNQEIEIDITSSKSYTIKKYKVVKVFNEAGVKNIDASEHYDKSSKIKWLDATMYNAFGKEIKSYKQKDFKDQSVLDGYSVITDDRIVYLDIIPTEYPFTLIYYSEIIESNTAFLPFWNPIDDINESVLKSSIKINYVEGLGFKLYETNIQNYSITKNEAVNSISYTLENAPALKYEELSPSFRKIVPKVNFALSKFHLKGVEGTATNWKDFGAWMYADLLADTEEINSETIAKVKTLIGTESDPLKKAKIIYKFVQDKTRYVSVQLGIGGWKPMLAKDVDRLGYGDCKALSNYTRSLLKAFDVPSYYTVIYGGNEKNDIQNDFVAMQGNHVVLSIPNNNKLTFLECTNQVGPFGFEGDFTDDRYALIIKPEGGEIVKTNSYVDKDNSQKMKSSYTVSTNGNIQGEIEIKSKGIVYDNTYMHETDSQEKINTYYKEIFENLVDLKIKKTTFTNDKELIEFKEKLSVEASNYAVINDNSMIFPLNAFNQFSRIPQRYRTRNNPFEISRGFYDEDEIEITIPEHFVIDAQPSNFNIKDKFGEYKTEIIVSSPTKLVYKRSLLIKKGLYDKSEYENFRKFTEQIAKADNAKILLIKKV
jgi:transglutaminase-like putative cysteine protease